MVIFVKANVAMTDLLGRMCLIRLHFFNGYCSIYLFLSLLSKSQNLNFATKQVMSLATHADVSSVSRPSSEHGLTALETPAFQNSLRRLIYPYQRHVYN